MPAMPETITQNTIGVIIMLSSLMKPLPSGCIWMAASGHTPPRTTAAAIAMITWL